MREPLYVIFDGPPSHESGRFVEVETADGKSVNAGTWENHSGKYWRLGPLYREPQASRLETGAMTDCCGGNCLMRCPPAAPAATPNEAVPKSELERLMSEKMEWAAERDRKDATIADLRGKLEQAQKDAESKQAKIDALMLEFCPDEMPAEQTANWAAHQVPASPEENAAIDAALKEASNG